MKRNTKDSAKPVSHKKRSKRSEDTKIIFGIFKIENGKETIFSKNQNYRIEKYRKNFSLPIKEGSEIKALLHRNEKGPQYATLLRVYEDRPSLKDRVAKILKETDVLVDFSKDTIREANQYGNSIKKSDRKNRTNLSDHPFCTIDGESAKDFDDAVFATKKGKNIEVFVAIADVSHYVKFSSSLDQDALSRGTSIYYPGHCIPMLPEQLSNELCSLKPKVERLSIVVSFELGKKGGIFKPRMIEAIIKSSARLTYNQVQKFYNDQNDKSIGLSSEIKASLLNLKTAAHILRQSRKRRGAIDFDLAESVVALDNLGEPIAIHPQDRLDSHKIIEDLMVATNEIVADFFERKSIPCLYRVHEAPDQEKLENFFKTASSFSALDRSVKTKASSITEPKAIQEVMSLYKKSKYKEILDVLMLRSMMQARYSEQNLMHFGLASTAYLHFTSPIRRYADLMVHRQLRYILFEKNHKKKIPTSVMKQIASSISDKELKATELERKIDRLYAATFMASRIGETFFATIVSCTEFGFFVRIVEHHVEGLVHISTISRHHVHFIPDKMMLVVTGSNTKYMVGDKVYVTLVNVNIDRGHVDFELAEEQTERKLDSKSKIKRTHAKSRKRKKTTKVSEQKKPSTSFKEREN